MDRMIDRDAIKVIAFDADDTLWANEPRFREAERRAAEVLKEYGPLEKISKELYSIEIANMEDYGYGAKAFVLSMLENAVKISGGRLTGEQTGSIIGIGRWLLHNPATPLEAVPETLDALRGRYSLAVITKGELLDQEHKLERSGLLKYFDKVEIVSHKGPKEYLRFCQEMGILPGELLSVGNSFKSDIAPVLEIGGWGIHIPFEVMWELERTEEYPHPRLSNASSILEVKGLLGLV